MYQSKWFEGMSSNRVASRWSRWTLHEALRARLAQHGRAEINGRHLGFGGIAGQVPSGTHPRFQHALPVTSSSSRGRQREYWRSQG